CVCLEILSFETGSEESSLLRIGLWGLGVVGFQRDSAASHDASITNYIIFMAYLSSEKSVRRRTLPRKSQTWRCGQRLSFETRANKEDARGVLSFSDTWRVRATVERCTYAPWPPCKSLNCI